MQELINVSPWWAALTVWCVVNLVKLLQSAGFLSRVRTRRMAINHLLGYCMIALGIPTALALLGFWYNGAAWLQWIGAAVYLAFLALMVVVDYIHPVEFRSPRRANILIPYLLLFFGSILLMGLPRFYINRQIWLVTAATSILLVSSMGVAMHRGVA
jgi:phosphatidylserine synthase